MGIRTFSPRKTQCRDLGRTLGLLLSLSLGACKTGHSETAGQPAPQKEPAKAPAKPAAAPAKKAPAAEPKPKPIAKKAPRAGDAPSRAGSIGDLQYIERVFDPAHRNAPKELPILVMIHGLGDRPDNFLHLADALTKPHRALSLQGLSPYNGSFGNGFAWFKTRVKAGKEKKLAAEIDKAAAFVAKGLRALNKEEGKKGRRFVITGFSQGGILSYALAVQYPELIATALPISGLLPKPARRPKGKARSKIIAFHGQADTIVPYAQSVELGAWLDAQGYDYALQSFAQVGHRIPPNMATPLHQSLDAQLSPEN